MMNNNTFEEEVSKICDYLSSDNDNEEDPKGEKTDECIKTLIAINGKKKIRSFDSVIDKETDKTKIIGYIRYPRIEFDHSHR